MTIKRRRAAATARRAEAEAACLMATLSHAVDRSSRRQQPEKEGARERERERETRAQHCIGSPTDGACKHRQPKGTARVRRGEGDDRSDNYGTADQRTHSRPAIHSVAYRRASWSRCYCKGLALVPLDYRVPATALPSTSASCLRSAPPRECE